MDQELREQLLSNPPKFHWWDNQERVGGMGPRQLHLIECSIERLNPGTPRIFVETGAGVSTVWALNMGMEVHSFVADQQVANKIAAFLAHHPDLSKRWHPVVGFSESTLPLASLGGLKAGICLIDGGHGIQTVFVDFVYLNYSLVQGGVMLIDDLQLGSSSLLADLIKQDKNYRFLSQAEKLGEFQKVSDRLFLGDWTGQSELLDQIRKALHPAENGGRPA